VIPDSQLQLDDEQARRDALDVSRSFIVQAPAGSGKTELLIQRYLRLLAIVEHPEEILAITFTRKAAAEMQLRVVQALKKAAAGEKAQEDYEQVTAQAAAIVLQRDKDLDWSLIANPRRMRIQTLDSLNASIARTQPLTSSGGAAGSTISADAEMGALYRQAAALTLDLLVESGEMQQVTRDVLLHVDNNTSIYVAYLARMLATRDQWLPFVGSGLVESSEAEELRSQFELGLEYVSMQHLEKLHQAWPGESVAEIVTLARYAAANLRVTTGQDDGITALSDIERLPDAATDALPLWVGIAELLLTKQGGWRKQATKNQGFPAGDDGQKETLYELIASLDGQEECRRLLHDVRGLPPLSYSDEQWSVLLSLFRLLPMAATELKRLFVERGITDHIEVALAASAALGTADDPGDVALLLDYQLRHLLVDEMQDTSSAQYRMLEALTGGWSEGDGRTLFCVGDPMQSIYRFRNAEVGQFLLAKQTGIGDVDLGNLTLRRNFRSGEQLVEWFNQVFPVVLAPHDDPQRSAVSYAKAISVPQHRGQGTCVIHPVIGADKEAEADTGFAVLRGLLDDVENNDVAVLVRGRTHLPELLYRLRDAGIAYQAVEIDRLTDLPEIIDVLAITRGLVHHGDRLAWLALLRSPWIGLSWSDLHALVGNDGKSTIWELLQDKAVVARLSQFAQTEVARFCEVLAPVLASCRAESLRDKVERAWLTLGGPAILGDDQAVENVYRYLDVVGKIEVAGTLPDVAELEDALDTEHVSTDAKARLQVMTMHRAKGLQFDHVMLFGLGRVPRNSDPEMLSWFDIPDRHGLPRKIISPVGPRADLERDRVHSYIGKIDAEKDRHELGRLLYVACTRARKSLHLTGHAQVLKSGLRPDPRSLLNLLWPIVAPQYERHLDTESGGLEDRRMDRWLVPELRRFERPWQMPEAPELPREAQVEGSAEKVPVEFYWVGADARLAGTLVHRWLHMAAEDRVDLRADLDAVIPAADRRWLREQGVTAAAGEAILKRVNKALQAVIDDDRGRWLLSGEGHAELPLTGLLKGRVESVVIDRVRVADDDTHWIVDYKTSSHEGGDLQHFLDTESDRYQAQLSKYAELYRNYSDCNVRCALYFPLLQEFVEVPV
jgi:ATP-dependent exoDNAse (exonuclease V) beta subunit